jgi:hypothetical protein
VIARIPEGLLARLHPQVSQQRRVRLDRVSLIVVVGRVDQLKAQVVPDRLEDGLVDAENEHAGLRPRHSLYGELSFGEADGPNILLVLEDGLLELLGIARPQKAS